MEYGNLLYGILVGELIMVVLIHLYEFRTALPTTKEAGPVCAQVSDCRIMVVSENQVAERKAEAVSKMTRLRACIHGSSDDNEDIKVEEARPEMRRRGDEPRYVNRIAIMLRC
jgi:hypothetical protein